MLAPLFPPYFSPFFLLPIHVRRVPKILVCIRLRSARVFFGPTIKGNVAERFSVKSPSPLFIFFFLGEHRSLDLAGLGIGALKKKEAIPPLSSPPPPPQFFQM